MGSELVEKVKDLLMYLRANIQFWGDMLSQWLMLRIDPLDADYLPNSKILDFIALIISLCVLLFKLRG